MIIKSKKELLTFINSIEIDHPEITKDNLIKLIKSNMLHWTQGCVWLGVEFGK